MVAIAAWACMPGADFALLFGAVWNNILTAFAHRLYLESKGRSHPSLIYGPVSRHHTSWEGSTLPPCSGHPCHTSRLWHRYLALPPGEGTGEGAFFLQADTPPTLLSIIRTHSFLCVNNAGTCVATTHVDWKLTVLMFCLLRDQEFLLFFTTASWEIIHLP